MTNVYDKPSRAKGYTLPKVICFDCGQPTGSAQTVRRYPYADSTRDLVTLVHRTGTGCHKNDSAR